MMENAVSIAWNTLLLMIVSQVMLNLLMKLGFASLFF
jgi:di/tricarboxylate transporter